MADPTYQEFEYEAKRAVRLRPVGIKEGTAAFNSLHAIRPDFAYRIIREGFDPRPLEGEEGEKKGVTLEEFFTKVRELWETPIEGSEAPLNPRDSGGSRQQPAE